MTTARSIAAAVAATALAAALAACSESSSTGSTAQATGADESQAPRAAQPLGLPDIANWKPAGVLPIEDLTLDNHAVSGVVAPTIIDTRTFPVQIQPIELDAGGEPLTGSVIVPGPEAPPIPEGDLTRGDASRVAVGRSDGGVNVALRRSWEAISNTGWNPPDPTLAVGPNHVVVTVNSRIEWFDKDGNLQFAAWLGSQGSPGFFEDVGASSFVFDPKCFYDHHSGRFVILGPEVYGRTSTTPNDDEATLAIAISDDSDPNGVWYKYRTNAVTDINGQTYWWDYPGLGYDEDAIYVTSNLFPLDPNNNSFGGAGFRVFDKAPILNGQPTTFSTIRSGSISSVQCAQHFSPTSTPYFASTGASNEIRITAIENPLTAPSLTTTSAIVPSFGFAGNAQTPSGDVSTVGSRVMNVHWVNDRLLTGHATFDSTLGQQQARWYEIDTGGWPTSGSPALVQSGQITDGIDDDTFFPAIYKDALGNIGIVTAASSETRNVSMLLSGRRPGDPLGDMGSPLEVFQGEFGSTGRWGDYYDIALDPADGSILWAVGQTQESGGWRTQIAEFSIAQAIDVLSPDGGEDLPIDVVTTVSWDGNTSGEFQVQQTSNAGAVQEVVEGFESVDLPPNYIDAGDAAWFGQSAVVFDGTFAAQAGAIGNLQTSTMATTVEGPTTISFRYRTSSEPGDALRFRVGTGVELAASGETPWTEFTIDLPEGVFDLSWSYEKNFFDTAGSDTVWIDRVTQTADAEVWTDIVAQTPPGATSVSWTPDTATDAGAVRVRELLSGGAATSWERSDATFTVVPTPGCLGDVNGDLTVDVFDFSDLAAAFGSTPADPNWNPGADFNDDMIIDVFDFSDLAANFGLECS